MKISMAYHRARRDASRTMFVSRERSYHGVNVGGTSLAGMVSNRRTFQGMTLPVVHMRHTLLAENRCVLGQPAKGVELADDLQRMVDLYGAENIAACRRTDCWIRRCLCSAGRLPRAAARDMHDA